MKTKKQVKEINKHFIEDEELILKEDDKFFNFEMTARAKYINYSGDPITSSSCTSSDLKIKKMSLALKIKPKWGVSLGLLPFSSANYSFYSNKNIAGLTFFTASTSKPAKLVLI